MNIVILDGGTTNPGDISWAPFESLGNLTVYENTPYELTVGRAKDADAVIMNRAKIDRAVIEQLPKLKFIGALAIGYNTIDTVAAREHDITVCNVPFYCIESVTQQVFSLLLSLCGNVHLFSEKVRDGKWGEAVKMNSTSHPMFELYNKTMGIFGYGNIGKCVAGVARALGMKVLIYSRTQKEAPEGCRWVDMETLFKESDVVSLHCPLTPETTGIVGEKLIGLMKPTAYLINTSRGAVVDSAALAEALNNGKIAGAGVDVLPQEPPVDDEPLLTAKNCVITPHIAWAPKEARERLVQTVADNLRCFTEGHPQNVVN